MAPRKKKEAEAPPVPPKQQGRPSLFTQEIADEICERLAKGETLAQICKADNMPAVRTVSDWKAAHATFSADFAHAREEGYDAIAQQCLDIADETSNDTVYGDSGPRANSEWITRSKLRVDTRLKLLAKWDPKRYGDKVQLTGDGGGPLETKSTLDVTGLSTAALAEIMKARDAAEPR